MKKIVFLIAFSAVVICASTSAQIRIRANALGWGLVVPNIGAEVGLSEHTTFVAEGYYAPLWDTKGFRMKGWMVTPEFRYYFCEKFNKHYIGVHGNYGDLDRLQITSRYNIREGQAYGAGLTYGHQWIYNHNWSFDLFCGLGWWQTKVDIYCKCEPDFMINKGVTENKFGLTRLGASFAYRF